MMAKKSPKIVEVVTPMQDAEAQMHVTPTLVSGEVQMTAQTDDGVYGPLPLPVEAVTPVAELVAVAEAKAPREKGLVDLSFAYRTESAAFIEILLPEGEQGKVSWLRKSALKSWEVDPATATVKVVMPRALATRRKFSIAA